MDRNTKGFREWLSLYTNGDYSDYSSLSVALKDHLWGLYRKERKEAFGEPVGRGLIDIKNKQ